MKENAQFRKDLKTVRDIMVQAYETGDFYRITKREVLNTARVAVIVYDITDRVFKNRRKVIIIR